jgi:DNA-directed RNA polymerase specialized sigma subunit
LFLRYGPDLTQAEIGQQLGVTRQVICERLAQGVGRIVDYLNGAQSMAAWSCAFL